MEQSCIALGAFIIHRYQEKMALCNAAQDYQSS